MEKVLAVFDAYIDHAMHNYANGFRGCGLLNAAAEFPAGSPTREAVKEHKQEVEAIIAHHLLAAPTIFYYASGAFYNVVDFCRKNSSQRMNHL